MHLNTRFYLKLIKRSLKKERTDFIRTMYDPICGVGGSLTMISIKLIGMMFAAHHQSSILRS